MRRVKAKGAKVVAFKPTLPDGSAFFGGPAANDLKRFKGMCGCIVANRMSPELEGVADKVYTRDLFGWD